MEDSACARAAQRSNLTVLWTAAEPTSASSSHLGHVEHDDQVSGRTRSGKGWCHGVVRRTNDLVFHLRERERNGHAHAPPPSVHTWMPFTRMRLSIPVTIVGSTMSVCLRSSSPSSSRSSSFCGCVCVCLLARLLHRVTPLIFPSVPSFVIFLVSARAVIGSAGVVVFVFLYHARRAVCRLAVPPCRHEFHYQANACLLFQHAARAELLQ